jgi:hypothetical protein
MLKRTTQTENGGIGNAGLAGCLASLYPLIDTGRKPRMKRYPIYVALICSLASLGATSASAQEAGAKNKYEPASVRALPGLSCHVHAAGTASAKGIPVFTDDDGYARFYAKRAAQGDSVSQLTLDCKDSRGMTFSYLADLTSTETFTPRPLNLAAERGTDRPALEGDPLSYTQSELIHAGYGLRPDPAKDSAAYDRWLAAASKQGRMLEIKRPDLHSHTTTSLQAPWWVGSVMTGAPNYVATEAVFNVPTAIPGGDQTGVTEVAIWNGLGGFGTGSGLIQGGVNLYTTPSAAAYGTWREYCCGDSDSNGYGGAFVPKPGDKIFSQEWYCDSQGNININGGYGCTYLYDYNSGALLNCTVANGSPCWSVKASSGMTFGKAAEFIIEDQSPQVGSSTAFTDFTPEVTMTGSAYSTTTGSFSQTVNNDPNVYVLTDFTKTTSHVVVSLGSAEQTFFSMEPSQPSYPLYCQGPLSTGAAPNPVTSFKWAPYAAGVASPGAGQCAWADRPPEGAEIKAGNTNAIYGYLNQVANLPAGKYAEIGVYRDTNFNNDLVVTQIVGLVTPPFSGSPTLP